MSTVISHLRAYATVASDTATYTTTSGHAESLTARIDEDVRALILRRATDEARSTGAPVELVTSGDRGEYRLLVDSTGRFTPIDPEPPTSVSPEAEPAATRPSSGEETSDKAPAPSSRPTFLAPPPETDIRSTGWRGMLAGLGIHVRPSKAEQRRAEQIAVVARQWAGCRTLAVTNGKGGVGKTMTCAMLAAVYAREGGGNVLAWDNNDTRGTLGWRTDEGLYDTTLRDLLPAAPSLLESSAGVSDITRFVHHQATDRYDVLRSNPELLATDQRIATAEFDLLMRVAARYYRLVVFDSGNDESAERWLRMIDNSHQLVIPTLANPESAESASLLLDALHGRDEHSAELADRALVIVTQNEPASAAAARIADGFATYARAVQIIPFDPALKSGPLRFDTLRRRTRDAWLAAAASAAEGL